MTNDLSTAIDGLRSASARFNKLTDEAAASIKRVEDFLNKECSSGIDAHVEVSEDNVGDEQYYRVVTRYLSYCRVGPRYRIAVVWVGGHDPTDLVEKAWSDCKRDDKLETLEKLPELISEIAKTLQGKIEKAQKSLATATEVTNALVGKAG